MGYFQGLVKGNANATAYEDILDNYMLPCAQREVHKDMI